MISAGVQGGSPARVFGNRRLEGSTVSTLGPGVRHHEISLAYANHDSHLPHPPPAERHSILPSLAPPHLSPLCPFVLQSHPSANCVWKQMKSLMF